MPYWSLTNLFATATITCPTAEDANYPASNLAKPQRPDIPAKTTATGDLRYVFNLGAPKTLRGAVLLYVNFALVRWQANGSDAWTTPAFEAPASETLVNPGNGRLCCVTLFAVPQTFQFFSPLIPNVVPTDASGVYRIGGAWGIESGDWISRRGVRYDDEVDPISPADFLETKSLREQRIGRGPEFMALTGDHYARVGTIPYLNDELGAWSSFERDWWAKDFALYVRRLDHPAWIGVMRQRTRPKWKLGSSLARAPFDWREVTGP